MTRSFHDEVRWCEIKDIGTSGPYVWTVWTWVRPRGRGGPSDVTLDHPVHHYDRRETTRGGSRSVSRTGVVPFTSLSEPSQGEE